MNRRHNIEERLNVVSRILTGEPIKSLSRELGTHKDMIRQWYLRYQKYGESGLRGTISYHYTAAEKTMIVEEVTVKGLLLHEICLRYDLNLSTVKKWVRKARNGVPLVNKRRGRPPKDMARPKKQEPQTELEKLQA